MSGVRAVLAVWACWLAAVLAAIAAGAALLPQRGASAVGGPLGPVWGWDWNWYARIAGEGYPPRGAPEYAFLPLWPAVIRASEAIGAGAWGPWLLVVAATGALFAGAAAAHRRLDPAADATATAVALACLPGSSLLVVAYPDALVAAAIAWSAAVVARRPLAVVALLAVSAAARPTAILGVLPVAWEAARAARAEAAGQAVLGDGAAWRRRAWVAALVIVPTAVLAGVSLWFAARSGDALAFQHAQAEWQRTGVGALPGFFRDAVAQHQLRFLLAILLALLAAVGAVLLWLRGGAYRAWATFVASVLLVDLASGRLESLPRHLALAFPLAWILALELAARPRLRLPVLAAFAVVNLALAAVAGYLPP